LFIYGVNLKAIWAFVAEIYVELTVELSLIVPKPNPIKWANSAPKCLVYGRDPVAHFIIQQWNRPVIGKLRPAGQMRPAADFKIIV